MNLISYRYFYIVLLLFLPLFLFGQYKDRQQKRETIKQPLKCPTHAFQLVWYDEFNGHSLDTTTWQTSYGNPPPWDRTLPRSKCGTELQIYTDTNFKVTKVRLKFL